MMRRINTAVIIAVPVAFLAMVFCLVVAGGNENILGAFTTSLNGRSENQMHNIRLAARAIDGTVVQPGKVFSFNTVVGERNSGEGYVTAPAIVEGKLDEGIGGGICQVSSTLYNAVLLSGLEVVERHAHTSPPTSVPPGRDATVVFGGSDFRFENTSGRPVTVRVSADEGRLIVRIVGDGKKPPEYRLISEREESFRPVSTRRGSKGMRFITATVWREELNDGETGGREFISTDTYSMEK